MSQNKKKVLFLTGTRADFGKLFPLIQACEENENIEPHVFVTGMHTLSKYGMTKIEVENSLNCKVHSFINQRESDPLDIILSNTVRGLSDFIHELKPDALFVHGDRIEALAGAIVGSVNYIQTVHIEGGEVSGTIDEVLRHSITKLSHQHLVSNEQAKSRLTRMGEKEDSVHIIGSPDIDIMLSDSLPDIQEVKRHYEIPFDDYGILIFHPVTSELENIESQAQSLSEAALKSEKNFVVIEPNNDPGTKEIQKSYDTLPKERFRRLPSMRFKYFLSLLKNSSLFIGNSSVGVRETPIYGIQSIDFGSRQEGRAKEESIINVNKEDESLKISNFIVENWGKKYEPSKNFGSGDSKLLFSKLLNEEHFWQKDLQKRFVDN